MAGLPASYAVETPGDSGMAQRIITTLLSANTASAFTKSGRRYWPSVWPVAGTERCMGGRPSPASVCKEHLSGRVGAGMEIGNAPPLLGVDAPQVPEPGDVFDDLATVHAEAAGNILDGTRPTFQH